MPSPYVETTDKTTLFLRDWGTGQPVLLLHGWWLSLDMWQYQMIHLADNSVRAIAYDRRGHGRSTDPGRGYDYDTLAGELAAVLEHLQLKGVTLVGHSMGGGEIVRYLSRHGATRIARVVLLAPTLPFPLKTVDNPEGVDGRFFDNLRASWRRDFPKYLADNAQPFLRRRPRRR